MDQQQPNDIFAADQQNEDEVLIIKPEAARREITSADDVPIETHKQLLDLVAELKHHHSPGAAVTHEDMTKFLEMVFSGGWTTARRHHIPSKPLANAGFTEKSIFVGMLKEDLPTARMTKIASRNPATKHRVIKSRSPGTQVNRFRKAGAKVYCRVVQDAPQLFFASAALPLRTTSTDRTSRFAPLKTARLRIAQVQRSRTVLP